MASIMLSIASRTSWHPPYGLFACDLNFAPRMGFNLKAALADIVVIDARSRDAYIAGHIPGAVSFPHREMNAETAARLNPSKV